MRNKVLFKQGARWGKLQTSYPQGNVRVTSGSFGLLASIGDVSVIVRKIAAAVLLFFTLGVGNAWGATTTYTFTAKEWTSAAGNWTGTAGLAFESSGNERGVQVNTSLSTSSPSSFSHVTSIEIVASSNNATGTITVSIGSDEVATKTIANNANSTYTYNFSDDEDIISYSGNVKLDITPGTKSVWVKSVTVTYISEKFTVTYDAGSGVCGTASKKQDVIGEILTLPSATPNSNCVDKGWMFVGWATSSCSEKNLKPELYAGGSSYLPTDNITLYAVYKVGNAYEIDFESVSSAYTDWTFTNLSSQQTHANIPTAQGGSYFGSTNGTASASLTTNNKIADLKSIRFYISRQTTNSNESKWYVQTSENGSDWADRKEQDAIVPQGAWTEVTQDLSSYSNVYVRIYYSGSTAVRNIDEVELSCATYNSNPDCTYDYFVDIMHDNETIEKQGTYSAPAALSDATPGDEHCDDKHYHFLGWIEEQYVDEDGTLNDASKLKLPGASITASNKTFYAIWAKIE